jgi:DNA primase
MKARSIGEFRRYFVRRQPSTATIQLDSRQIDLSNRHKIFVPDSGITKGDLVDYYQRAAWMLPHPADRPLTLQRFPDGIESQGFYQNDAPDYTPAWVTRKNLEKSGGTVSHVVCNDQATLVYLANQGCITPHVWLNRIDAPRRSVAWHKLDRNLAPRKHHVKNRFRRLAQTGDPWQSLEQREQSLTEARKRLDAPLQQNEHV